MVLHQDTPQGEAAAGLEAPQLHMLPSLRAHLQQLACQCSGWPTHVAPPLRAGSRRGPPPSASHLSALPCPATHRGPLQAKTIVFVSTCKQVKFLFEALRKLRPGVPLRALHGKMNQYKRMGGEQRVCWPAARMPVAFVHALRMPSALVCLCLGTWQDSAFVPGDRCTGHRLGLMPVCHCPAQCLAQCFVHVPPPGLRCDLTTFLVLNCPHWARETRKHP